MTRFTVAALVTFAVLFVAAPAFGTPNWVTTARTELAKLRVAPLATLNGYSRDMFGPAWEDVDHNGCDTRNDILQRDLTTFKIKVGLTCEVATGVLHDPYTGKTMWFRRGVGTSSLIQIDRVVALADAWQTGAAQWTNAKRLRFANDPDELLAVNGSESESKGDDDASEWLPPNHAFDCRYIAIQVAVKTKYRLWVTRTERSAMSKALRTC